MITNQDIKDATLYVDGVDIYPATGALIEGFSVGGTDVKPKAYQGMDSTSFNVLTVVRGMRAITVSLFYKARDKRELALKKSKLDTLLGAGKIDLHLPDGFHYMAYLTNSGKESVLGVEGDEVIAVCAYKFNGIRHDDLVSVSVASGASFWCDSLAPKTDCKITCKSTANRASMTIGTVTITTVHVNDIITVDGINKRILQNGAPCAGNMSFIKFPKLVPGMNTISCPDTMTVEYYPTY